MKALCLGGCGFVGRRFCRRLLNDGWEVDVIDDLSTGLPLNKWPAFLQPTTEQRERLHFRYDDARASFRGGFLQPSAYDLVIHLAAVVGGRLKIEGDPLAVATDLSIDADFFNWLTRDAWIEPGRSRKVIYFSSSAVYPIESQQRDSHCALSEGMVKLGGTRLGMPDMTYGWSKLTGEYLAKHAVEKYGVDVAIYRPFSGYGADQSLDYPFPSIIKRVLNAMEGKNDIISVWGSGDQVRDFIYIEDVVDCVMATYQQLAPGEALNIGSGEGVSFYQLVYTACKVLGHDVPVIHDPDKPEGVFYRVADTHKLSQFDWKPSVSLEEGIERVAKYLVDSGQAKV